MNESPSPDGDEDLDPLEDARSMLDCIADELDETREHLRLAEDTLAKLRALIDSGELRN